MIVIFPDARAAVLAVLRGLGEPGVTYGTRPLDDYPADDVPSVPYVMVAQDATSTVLPVTETAVMRVTVWADSEYAAHELARRLRARLLAAPATADLRGFGAPVTGPIATTDPDTNRPLSTFSVGARLRPTIV